jgi:hypothetical protein
MDFPNKVVKVVVVGATLAIEVITDGLKVDRHAADLKDSHLTADSEVSIAEDSVDRLVADSVAIVAMNLGRRSAAGKSGAVDQARKAIASGRRETALERVRVKSRLRRVS